MEQNFQTVSLSCADDSKEPFFFFRDIHDVFDVLEISVFDQEDNKDDFPCELLGRVIQIFI